MINIYLDIAKEKNNLRSDAELGRKLKVTRAAVNNWRSGKTVSQEVILKIAKMCNMKPEQLLAEYELGRDHTPEVKSMWKRVAVQAGSATISMIFASAILMHSLAPLVSNNIYYVKLKKRMRESTWVDIGFGMI